MISRSKRYRCIYSSCAITSESTFNLGRRELDRSYKKKHCPDTGGKPDETVKRQYDSQQSGLEVEKSDMVCQKDRSPSPGADLPTLIAQDNEFVPERGPGFAIEFSEL